MMARLSVALLGPPVVRHADRAVAFPTRKALALFAYLLTEGGAHPRESLVARFWPDSEPAAGRATLRSTLARLRDALSEPSDVSHLRVERGTVGVTVGPDLELDLHRLEAACRRAREPADLTGLADESRRAPIAELQAAADLWRGDFLDGFSLPDAPELDGWLGLQREVWRRRLDLVLDRLAGLYADRGALADAVDTAMRRATLSPLDERAQRRLMQLHLAAGDRAAALRAYEACRARLEEELQSRPDPDTEALAERIRALAPAARPGASDLSTSDRAACPTVAADHSPDLIPPLVGRAEQFQTLVELYHVAGRGRPRAAVLQGEAGIGKTRLGLEFAGWAASRGADVLRGRAFQAGGGLPYQPLVEAFRPRLERENAPEDLLGDVWLAELVRLLPELRERYPDLAPPGADDAAARLRLFEATARLGQALARRAPLVLFLDDVQWADAASLDVLRYAARRWAEGGDRILLLLGLRSETVATTPALEEWLLGLGRELVVDQVELGTLGMADVEDMVRGLGPAPGAAGTRRSSTADSSTFARWLYAETGGQPLFVVETLRALAERGALAGHPEAGPAWTAPDALAPTSGDAGRTLPTAGVQRVIRDRLARLTPTARDLLAGAAVLGQDVAFEQVCAVVGLDERDALPALDEVVRGNLLREVDATGRYAFGHDRIRDVVYADAGAARRRVFHRRALAALAARAAPAADLAHHAEAAGLDDRALDFRIAAGEQAMRLLAARDAAGHYECAIHLAERLSRPELAPELHARRGEAFASVARWADARRELEAALAGLPPDQLERRAEVSIGLAEACFWLLDIATVRRHAAVARGLAHQCGRVDIETGAIAWHASTEASDGNIVVALQGYDDSITQARALGQRPPAIAFNKSLALYWVGRLDEAVGSSREGVAAAQAMLDMPGAIYSLSHLGIALAGRGRYDEAARTFDEARRLGREYGVETILARAIAMSAGFHLDVHDFAGAEALAREARDFALSLGFPPPVTSAGLDLLLGYVRRGDVARAEALVPEVAEVAARAAGFHGWLWRLRLAQARAEIAVARGAWDEALGRAGEAIEQASLRGRVKYVVLGLGVRARALVGLGHTGEAVAELRTALARARPVGDPALLLRAASWLLPIEGDDDLAAEARATAASIVRALPDEAMRRAFEASDAVRAVAR